MIFVYNPIIQVQSNFKSFMYFSGLRPERLSVFDADCWKLMEECWESEPMKRPLLGDVENRLKYLHTKYLKVAPVVTSKDSKHSSPRQLNIAKQKIVFNP